MSRKSGKSSAGSAGKSYVSTLKTGAQIIVDTLIDLGADTMFGYPGGVVLNIGSAVILPEVFLKALTVARNLGHRASGFSTANFDMIRQYRPTVNVVERPTQKRGRGYNFVGHHEIMIPLLAAAIVDADAEGA